MFRQVISAAAMVVVLGATDARAEANAGAYLAARQAGFGSDFAAAAEYFQLALESDPSNPVLMENALTARVSLGQMNAAIPLARAMVDLGQSGQLAHLVLDAEAARTGDWAYVFEALEAGRTVGPLVDGLAQAWAHVGLGEVGKALQSFDEVIAAPGLGAYGLYHKALALASVGDFEGAEAIFALAPDGGLRHNRRSAIAHAQILSQLDRNTDAVALMDAVFGSALDPRLTQLRARLAAGESIPYDMVTSPVEGLAEVYMVVAEALRGETQDGYTLLYARASEYLRPDNTETLLLSADLLEDIGRFELATAAYARVLPGDPAFPAAELGRAGALRTAGNMEAAIEVLQSLTRSHPDLPQVHSTMGDTLRRMDDMAGAEAAYTRALDLYPQDNSARWFILYTRAITRHAQDNWPPAEEDFRAALALNPDQPQVLNYLGYSLVERGEKLDEALRMIETAVAAQPENGAIVDSLGWVLFQLGRYEEAVVIMEQAASLEAVDPIVNDHLGDAYWAVGRQTEARFQWQRAMSFDPTDEDAARIRRKLEVGLDVVRAEEGAAPIKLAAE